MTRRIIGIVCVLGLLATTCGRKASPPTSPTTTDSTTGAQTAPANSVFITGTSPIQPGETVQFRATARLNDQSTQDVTAAATWRSSTPAMLSVAPGGLVTAVTAGEATISITYQNRNAFLNVVSLSNGTGILSGYIRESTFPIVDARIEVVGGRFAGRSVTANTAGFYRMYDVVGDLQVRASADGYVAQSAPIAVLPFTTPRRDQTLNLDLLRAVPVVSLAGNYRATLRASASCAGKIPADLAVREYLATVTQDRSSLTIVLSGAEFATMSSGPSNRFVGRSKPDSVELAVGYFYYYYYYYYQSFGFVERLIRPPVGKWGFSQTSYLTVVGTAVGSASPSSFSTVMNGTIGLVDAPTGFTSGRRTTVGSCRASDHQMVFVRQ